MKQKIRQTLKPLTHPIKELSDSGKLGGVLLILSTILSITITNSTFSPSYLKFWNTELGIYSLSMPINHWINDLWMSVFFFYVGLEIKRELVNGELAEKKKALLPFIAAIGGMLTPALLFILINANTNNLHGWAIPTATDIAFSLGILSLLGNRVPLPLKIFLTALAIIDDLGGILIIALFYTHEIHFNYLAMALGIMLILALLNRQKISAFVYYIFPILLLWYCIYQSGVHATIAGVIAAFFIPTKNIERYEHLLNKPVNNLILPLFALANTTILLSGNSVYQLMSPLGIGVVVAMVAGKTFGITAFVWISIKMQWCSLQNNIHIKHICGVATIAGIGFTMSLFFTALSFTHPESANIAKLAILLGSTLSAILGLIYLRFTLPTPLPPPSS